MRKPTIIEVKPNKVLEPFFNLSTMKSDDQAIHWVKNELRNWTVFSQINFCTQMWLCKVHAYIFQRFQSIPRIRSFDHVQIRTPTHIELKKSYFRFGRRDHLQALKDISRLIRNVSFARAESVRHWSSLYSTFLVRLVTLTTLYLMLRSAISTAYYF